MLLRCTSAFGNFAPGDEVEVPDGAVFDTAYFERDVPEAAVSVAELPTGEEEGK